MWFQYFSAAVLKFHLFCFSPMRNLIIRLIETVPPRTIFCSGLVVLAGLITTKVVGYTSGFQGLLNYSSALNIAGMAIALASLGAETGLVRAYHQRDNGFDLGMRDIFLVGALGGVIVAGLFFGLSILFPSKFEFSMLFIILGFSGGMLLFLRVVYLATDRGYVTVICQACVLFIIISLTLLIRPKTINEYFTVITSAYALAIVPFFAFLIISASKSKTFDFPSLFKSLMARFKIVFREVLPRIAGFSVVSMSSLVMFQICELGMRYLVIMSGEGELFANAEAYVRINTLWHGFVGLLIASLFRPRYSKALDSLQGDTKNKLLWNFFGVIVFSAVLYLPVGFVIFLFIYDGLFNVEFTLWLLFGFLFTLKALGNVLSAAHVLMRNFFIVLVAEIMLPLIPILVLIALLGITDTFRPIFLSLALGAGFCFYLCFLIYHYWRCKPIIINESQNLIKPL